MTLVYLAIAWGGGILLAHFLWSQGLLGCATPAWPLPLLAGSAGLATALFRRNRRLRWTLGLCFLVLLGAWRYHAHPLAACPTPADLAFYHQDDRAAVWATVEGVVIGYPDVRDVRTHYRLRAEKVTIGGTTHRVTGDLLVQAPRFPEYAYGDRLRVTGQLQTPPVLDDFDYRAYLAQRGIHSLMRRPRVERVARGEGSPFWTALYGLRSRGSALLNRVLPEPVAALANGMTLGIESGIPPAVDEAFKVTGTSHVIVISGSNIAILSAALMAGLGRLLGKRRAAPPTIAAILLYVLLVGADPAALRAGLMGSLYVAAILLGRQSTAFVSLAASGIAMTALNPLALWDIGFQLSFAATLGLILFTPALTTGFERILLGRLPHEAARRVLQVLNDTVIVTLAAQVTTLPLLVYYFGRLSLISLLTNFLILPVQPPILLGGLLTVAGGLLWEPIGRLLAVLPWLFLTYTVAVVKLTAALPLASVPTGAAGQTLALIYYAALGVGLIAPRLGWLRMAPSDRALLALPTPDWPPARPGADLVAFSPRAAVWAAAIIVPAWLGMTALAALPDGRLHLFFVPAEDGEAALIVTPEGLRAWVWDGRGDGAALTRAAAALRPGWARRVDMTLAPPTADRAGLPPADQFLDPGQLVPGATLRLGGLVTLQALDAGGAPAWALTYRNFRTLLPADLTPAAQAALLAHGQDVRVTLLKTAGPGTGAWPTAPFLQAAAPQLILWPQDTTYPPAEAEWLAAQGVRRVPADAVIEVISDGARLEWRAVAAGSRR